MLCATLIPIFLTAQSNSASARALQIEPITLLQASQIIDIRSLSGIGRKGAQLGSPLKSLEISCFATGLYHEARGESREGQLAVAQVILNRMKSSAYPDTACGVIYQNAHMRNRCQFSFACDHRSDNSKNAVIYAELKQMASRALHLGHAPFPADTSAGSTAKKIEQATHYHTKAVSPSWGRKIKKVATIGAHIFYRSERVAKSL